jgi:hypothetical protein
MATTLLKTNGSPEPKAARHALREARVGVVGISAATSTNRQVPSRESWV